MKIPPLPTLAIVTAVQVCLAIAMFYVAWTASASHQRTAELYADHLRLHESSKSDAAPFVRLASREAAKADLSFRYASLLALGIVVLAGVQLWLAVDARRVAIRATEIEHEHTTA
jgi:hypothetical protein